MEIFIKEYLFKIAIIWYFINSKILYITHVTSHVINEDKIILYPKSCVNLTISEKISDKIVLIRLLSSKTQYKGLLWSDNFPKEEINYYYIRYVNNVGHNWMSLCNVDHTIANHYIEFEVKKNSDKNFYLSKKILLAHCAYVSDCQRLYFPNDNTILNAITMIETDVNPIELKLNFNNSSPIIFIRYSICYYLEKCLHLNIEGKKIYHTYAFNNFIQFDTDKIVIKLKVNNFKLSDSTLHILFERDNKRSMVTTTFIFKERNIKTMDFKNAIYYYSPSYVTLIHSASYFIDNLMDSFFCFHHNLLDTQLKVTYSNLLLESNVIRWSFVPNITYSIIFMDFKIEFIDIYFFETVLIILDYDKLYWSNNFNITKQNHEKNEKLSFYEKSKNIHSFMDLRISIIVVSALTILLLFIGIILLRKTQIKMRMKMKMKIISHEGIIGNLYNRKNIQ